MSATVPALVLIAMFLLLVVAIRFAGSQIRRR
jgi:hypothetical protein